MTYKFPTFDLVKKTTFDKTTFDLISLIECVNIKIKGLRNRGLGIKEEDLQPIGCGCGAHQKNVTL
jgi:hypothetical protein